MKDLINEILYRRNVINAKKDNANKREPVNLDFFINMNNNIDGRLAIEKFKEVCNIAKYSINDNNLLDTLLNIGLKLIEKYGDKYNISIKETIYNLFRFSNTNLSITTESIIKNYPDSYIIDIYNIIDNNKVYDRILDNVEVCSSIINNYNYHISATIGSHNNRSTNMIRNLTNKLTKFITEQNSSKIEPYVLFNIVLEVVVYSIGMNCTSNNIPVEDIVSTVLEYFIYYDLEFSNNEDTYKELINKSIIGITYDTIQLSVSPIVDEFLRTPMTYMNLNILLEKFKELYMYEKVAVTPHIIRVIDNLSYFSRITAEEASNYIINFTNSILEGEKYDPDIVDELIKNINIIKYDLYNGTIADKVIDRLTAIINYTKTGINNYNLIKAYKTDNTYQIVNENTLINVYESHYNTIEKFNTNLIKYIENFNRINDNSINLYVYGNKRCHTNEDVLKTGYITEDNNINIPICRIEVLDESVTSNIVTLIEDLCKYNENGYSYELIKEDYNLYINLESYSVFELSEESKKLSTTIITEASKETIANIGDLYIMLNDYIKEYDRFYKYGNYSLESVNDIYKDCIDNINSDHMEVLTELSHYMTGRPDNYIAKYIESSNSKYCATGRRLLNNIDYINMELSLESTKIFHDILLEGKFSFNDAKLKVMAAIDKAKQTGGKVVIAPLAYVNTITKKMFDDMDKDMTETSREMILKGSIIPSFKKVIQYTIHYALVTGIFGVAVAFITGVVHFIMMKETTKQQRQIFLDEIETELVVVKKEIDKAESSGNTKKYRQLLLLEKKLQREAIKVRNKTKVGRNIANKKMDMKNQDNDY